MNLKNQINKVKLNSLQVKYNFIQRFILNNLNLDLMLK